MLRCMNVNKRIKPIYVAYFLETEEVTEEKDGYTVYTGDRVGSYTELKELKVSVAPKSYFYNGDATVTNIFGTDLNYDKVIVADWTNKGAMQIDEYSRLWIDVEPYVDGVLQPHDYEVKRIEITHDRTACYIAIGRVSRNE